MSGVDATNAMETSPQQQSLLTEQQINPAKRRRNDALFDENRSEKIDDDLLEETMTSSASPPLSSETFLPSAQEVTKLMAEVSEHRSILLKWLANEKHTPLKVSIRGAIEGFTKVISRISNAYTYSIAHARTSESYASLLERACVNIERASSALAPVPRNASGDSETPNLSYASVARANNLSAPRKIQLDQGKPISIVSTKRVIVAPSTEHKDKFANSLATKSALLNAVDPAALHLKVKHVNLGKDKSVIVEGDCLEPLFNCKSLMDAGLNVSDDTKLDPRIIIHGVPVEYEKDDIAKHLVSQNFPHLSCSDFNVVYVYPAGRKRYRSCVVQMKSSCRNLLLQLRKVSIGWKLCEYADHISLLQCFKCLKFGHKADECDKNATCANCAGSHLTSECTGDNPICCVNCKEDKLVDLHSAFDKAKCPILRKKIERKASRIDYGS